MAVRLIFAYEGGDLRLVSRQRVDMVTPPTDAPATPAAAAGLWAELRDVQGQVLERRAVPDFLRGDVEVFGPDPAPSVSRAPVERPTGAFAVLLPRSPAPTTSLSSPLPSPPVRPRPQRRPVSWSGWTSPVHATSDGRVVGTSTVVDSGPPIRRWNLVVACGGAGALPPTYFDAAFCTRRIQRLLVVDNVTAFTVAGDAVPQWSMVLVVVNSSVYGGSGGGVAVYSLAGGAEEIALHEMGHIAFGLADEYEFFAGCGVDTDRDRHPDFEPPEPNVTTDVNPATSKWRDLVRPATPLPTTRNADCRQCARSRTPCRPRRWERTRGPVTTTAAPTGRNSTARCARWGHRSAPCAAGASARPSRPTSRRFPCPPRSP